MPEDVTDSVVDETSYRCFWRIHYALCSDGDHPEPQFDWYEHKAEFTDRDKAQKVLDGWKTSNGSYDVGGDGMYKPEDPHAPYISLNRVESLTGDVLWHV